MNSLRARSLIKCRRPFLASDGTTKMPLIRNIKDIKLVNVNARCQVLSLRKYVDYVSPRKKERKEFLCVWV